MSEVQFAFVEDAGRAVRTLSELVVLVATAGTEFRYADDQSCPVEGQEFDPTEAARAIQRLKAHTETADRLVESIKTIYGGPQGTTGYSSPVEAAYDQAKGWREVIYQMHGEAKKRLLSALTVDLRLNEPGGR